MSVDNQPDDMVVVPASLLAALVDLAAYPPLTGRAERAQVPWPLVEHARLALTLAQVPWLVRHRHWAEYHARSGYHTNRRMADAVDNLPLPNQPARTIEGNPL